MFSAISDAIHHDDAEQKPGAAGAAPEEDEGLLHKLVDKVEDLVLHDHHGAAQPAAAGGTTGNAVVAAAPTGMQTTVPPNGNKKALLVGINYLHSSKGRLNGCINDVNNVAGFLQSNLGYNAARMRVLTDDQPSNMPTVVSSPLFLHHISQLALRKTLSSLHSHRLALSIRFLTLFSNGIKRLTSPGQHPCRLPVVGGGSHAW